MKSFAALCLIGSATALRVLSFDDEAPSAQDCEFILSFSKENGAWPIEAIKTAAAAKYPPEFVDTIRNDLYVDSRKQCGDDEATLAQVTVLSHSDDFCDDSDYFDQHPDLCQVQDPCDDGFFFQDHPEVCQDAELAQVEQESSSSEDEDHEPLPLPGTEFPQCYDDRYADMTTDCAAGDEDACYDKEDCDDTIASRKYNCDTYGKEQYCANPADIGKERFDFGDGSYIKTSLSQHQEPGREEPEKFQVKTKKIEYFAADGSSKMILETTTTCTLSSECGYGKELYHTFSEAVYFDANGNEVPTSGDTLAQVEHMDLDPCESSCSSSGSTSEEELAEIKAENSSSDFEFAEIEAEHSSSSGNLAEIEAEHSSSSGNLAEIEAENSSSDFDFAEIEAEHSSSSGNLAQVEAENSSSDFEFAEIEAEHSSSSGNLAEIEAEHSSSSGNLAEIENCGSAECLAEIEASFYWD